MKRHDFESDYLCKYTIRQLCAEEDAQSTGEQRATHYCRKKQPRKPKRNEKF